MTIRMIVRDRGTAQCTKSVEFDAQTFASVEVSNKLSALIQAELEKNTIISFSKVQA